MRKLTLLTSLGVVLALTSQTVAQPAATAPRAATTTQPGAPTTTTPRATVAPQEALRAAWTAAGGHIAIGDWSRAAAALAPVADQLDPNGLIVLAVVQTCRGDAAAGDATLARGIARWPHNEALRLAVMDRQLARGQHAAALQGYRDAIAACGATSELHWRAARAYFAAGAYLGAVAVREVPDGRVGRFIGGWLLLEARPGRDHYLCCPEDSALYHVRQALEGGLDRAEVHLLHARLWQRAGRPELGLALLRGREADLLTRPEADVPATFAELALAVGDLGGFLSYAQQHADRDPAHHAQILFAADLAGAELCAQRGDDALYRNLLNRALELQPDDVPVLLRTADADWDAEQRTPAAALYRRVLALEPDHAARRRILERLAAAEPTTRSAGGAVR